MPPGQSNPSATAPASPKAPTVGETRELLPGRKPRALAEAPRGSHGLYRKLAQSLEAGQARDLQCSRSRLAGRGFPARAAATPRPGRRIGGLFPAPDFKLKAGAFVV